MLEQTEDSDPNFEIIFELISILLQKQTKENYMHLIVSHSQNNISAIRL
jgi:hypothetical protein